MFEKALKIAIGTKENNYTVELSNGELFKLPGHFFRPTYSFIDGKLVYGKDCQQCAKTRENGNH